MERLLQYLDDIDDLVGAVGLLFEQLRRLFFTTIALAVGLVSIAAGVLLALAHPPIALATSLLLLVTLVYRMVASPSRDNLQIV
jgi:hypothetical protein